MDQNISYNVLGVVSRALSLIDSRLMGHGERVAYLCEKMLETGGKTDSVDKRLMLPLALLHDVGAYKTEDIDKMVVFETKDVTRHAVFGYLFLKNRSFLGDSAEAVLYHHTPYPQLSRVSSEHTCDAALIYICDRVDVLMAAENDNVLESISRLSGSVFDPELVIQLERCEKEFSVIEKLKSGAWESEFDSMKRRLLLTYSEAMELVHMLVYSIDFRSSCTVTHTAGTVAFARELGRLMGFTGEDFTDLLTAAFLHDIGKIATPIEILEKPGRLTPEEMTVMREHILHSERILRGIAPDSITDIAVRHHEKLNGCGYPNGLSADDLTDAQRILSVADVLSALTGKRSYKEPFSKEQTLSIIGKMVDGGELSAKVFDVLIAHYDEIEKHVSAEVAQTEDLYQSISEEYHVLTAQMSAL